MSDSSAHRVPRAGLDPITDADTALAVIRLAVSEPPHHETILVTLDDRRCGIHLAVVHHTDADDIVDVCERLLEAAEPAGEIDGLIAASVRPGADGPCLPDADRWLQLDEVADSFGVELVEWFVLGRSVSCPRQLIGEAPRW